MFSRGACWAAANPLGENALHIAVMGGNAKLVEMIVKRIGRELRTDLLDFFHLREAGRNVGGLNADCYGRVVSFLHSAPKNCLSYETDAGKTAFDLAASIPNTNIAAQQEIAELLRKLERMREVFIAVLKIGRAPSKVRVT